MSVASSVIVARLRQAGCVFAEDEAALIEASARSAEHLESLVAERVTGTPLEHVLGFVDFCGDRYELGVGVFVPRPRTAAVVREAVAIAAPSAVIADLCCGSGAVGLAVARRVSGSTLYATDLDPVAVHWARRNLAPFGGWVGEGDLFAALPGGLSGRIDLVTVVAPYVPHGQIELLPHEARDYEPRRALDGGDDGLDLVRRILVEAAVWLAPGGHLVTELSQGQTPAAVSFAEEHGLLARVHTDAATEATLVVATRVA